MNDGGKYSLGALEVFNNYSNFLKITRRHGVSTIAKKERRDDDLSLNMQIICPCVHFNNTTDLFLFLVCLQN